MWRQVVIYCQSVMTQRDELYNVSLLVAVSSHDSFSDPLFTVYSNWRDIMMSWFYRMPSPCNVFTIPPQARLSFPFNFATCSTIRYCYVMMERQTTVSKDTSNEAWLTLSSPDLVLYVNVKEASTFSKMHRSPSTSSLYRLTVLLLDGTVVSNRPTT